MNSILSKIKLITNLLKELLFLVLIFIAFISAMTLIDHNEYRSIWLTILLVFSVIKVFFLVSHTMKKLEIMVNANHSFNHTVILLTAIIALIVVSFAFDYHCISQLYMQSFSGVDYTESSILRFTNFLYFSIVTFTTVGYGDIYPAMLASKFLTVLEMISSFVVIVFIISKYIRSK